MGNVNVKVTYVPVRTCPWHVPLHVTDVSRIRLGAMLEGFMIAWKMCDSSRRSLPSSMLPEDCKGHSRHVIFLQFRLNLTELCQSLVSSSK